MLFALLVFPSACTPAPIKNTARQNSQCNTPAIINSGCNANICFALDTTFLSDSEFSNATEFTQEVASFMSGILPQTRYSAVQFGLFPEFMAFANNSQDFRLSIGLSGRLLLDSGGSSIGIGLAGCENLLQLQSGEGVTNKIVLLTDSFADIGIDAVSIADIFREKNPNGGISVIGIDRFGFANEFLEPVAGNNGHLTLVNDFADLPIRLPRLTDIICQICDVV